MLRRMLKYTFAVAVLAALGTGASAQTATRVGVTPTPPFGGDNGAYVDLMNAVAEVAGITIEYTRFPFGELPAALVAGQIDVIAAPHAPTPERLALGIVYTAPVFTFGEGLVVRASDATNYATLAQLGGPIGTAGSVVYMNAITAAGLEGRNYPTIVELMAAVASGEIRGALYPDSTFALLQAGGEYANLRLVESYVTTIVSEVAISVRGADADLFAQINAALTTLQSDGRLLAIQTRWHMAP